MHRHGELSIQQKKNKIILRQEQIMEISKKKKILVMNFRKSAPFNILEGKSNGMKITGKKFSKHFDTTTKFKCVLFQKIWKKFFPLLYYFVTTNFWKLRPEFFIRWNPPMMA